ncbi:hypothetical protein [Lacticaseibacillus nasuensis]|uniref:hypothetical protein n=1 Tax=Lacticaseibacillus nasuensis TaxID=944671 RepID=UPI00158463B0|nr:hypothetical protein [Lacticaseibacillus nasuensis]
MLIKDVEISFADYLAYQHWFQRTDHQARWTNRLIDCLGALLAGLGLIIVILGRPIGWFFSRLWRGVYLVLPLVERSPDQTKLSGSGQRTIIRGARRANR